MSNDFEPIDFSKLVPARTVDEERADVGGKNPEHGRQLTKMRRDGMGRLLAQEYVRNGMNMADAIERTFRGRINRQKTNFSNLQVETRNAFFDELSKLVANSDVDRERALSILWTMVNTSLLDFMDDHGRFLPVKELKKLPRLMQLCLSKIKIERHTHALKDRKGNPILDDMGRPFVETEEYVHIEMPERMAAINQLAQLMKWVGPQVIVANFNIGRHMADADERLRDANRVYEAIEDKTSKQQ